MNTTRIVALKITRITRIGGFNCNACNPYIYVYYNSRPHIMSGKSFLRNTGVSIQILSCRKIIPRFNPPGWFSLLFRIELLSGWISSRNHRDFPEILCPLPSPLLNTHTHSGKDLWKFRATSDDTRSMYK